MKLKVRPDVDPLLLEVTIMMSRDEQLELRRAFYLMPHELRGTLTDDLINVLGVTGPFNRFLEV